MGVGGLSSRALWRVRPYLAPYKRHITVVMVTSVISSVGMVAVPLIVKNVIDGPLAEGDRAGVMRWALLAAGIATGGGGPRGGVGVAAARGGHRDGGVFPRLPPPLSARPHRDGARDLDPKRP